ncbi:MAG: hypothetical protein ACON5H_08665 [Akkermansiaceae bacterium]
MESDLQKLEAELRKLTPCEMQDDLVARLDEAMCRWHESVPVEEKVVSLSGPEVPARESWFQWRAVAAVAIFGVAAALFLTQESPSNDAGLAKVNQAGIPHATFTPREAKAQIVGFQNQGFVTSSSGQTYQAVGVKVSNQVHYQNRNGDRAKLEKPTYEVIYVPLDVD